MTAEVGAPHSAGPPQPSITSPGHTNSPAPRPAHHRHRPKDAPSRDSKHQAPPSHTGVLHVLADLSMTPVAPCRGLPFATTGLRGLQPRAPPSSPSQPFTPAHAQRQVTVAERGQTPPLKPAQRSPGSSWAGFKNVGSTWAGSERQGEKSKLFLIWYFKSWCFFSPSGDRCRFRRAPTEHLRQLTKIKSAYSFLKLLASHHSPD